ncbi:hypothetical protein BN13_420071 [Nostocoides jenkinsii Ben 74]|uniref:Uncharacterized protein n=1 Tax=Nostocoides jenkinsii Ben 74 TaxID=1193518 RepID=A0A077MEX0_9MICO|nr:hypothetical protein BN13_420071 [Tetrasphaera jenkinsii Ben 74]
MEVVVEPVEPVLDSVVEFPQAESSREPARTAVAVDVLRIMGGTFRAGERLGQP